MKDANLCLWCTSPLPARTRRGSARRFCGPSCRQQHHAAGRQLGSYVAAARLGAPGDLKRWRRKACTLRERGKSDQDVSDAPARPERAYGFCQHGLFWYVTDRKGRKVGDPIKTPEQAKRLARQFTARKAEEPEFSVPLAQIEIEPGVGPDRRPR